MNRLGLYAIALAAVVLTAVFLLTGSCAAPDTAPPAPAAPAAPGAVDFAGLKALVEKTGYAFKENKAGFTVYLKNRENWFMEVALHPDQSTVFVVFTGGALPAKYDPGIPVKLLKENSRGGLIYFGILEQTNQVFLTYPIGNKDLTPEKLKQAITEMTIHAARTSVLWDTRLWPANPPD